METVLPREARKLASAIEEYEQAIALLNDDLQQRDNRIQTIQYENVGLQGEIRNARQTVIDLIENRHFPRTGKYDNVLCVFEKNKEGEMGWAGEHPYYLVRCQKGFFQHTNSG